MKQTHAQTELVGRRGELMAELFFQGLNPTSIARPPDNFGYDLLVSFTNKNGGINTFGVEVKATERSVPSSFAINRRTYDRLAHSTIQGLLLVVDVKQNRLFFGWPRRVDTRKHGSGLVSIPLTEINNRTQGQLLERLIA